MCEYKETEGIFEIRILDDGKDEKPTMANPLLEDLKSLKPVAMTYEASHDEPLMISREKKPKEKKPKKKKGKLSTIIDDSDLILTDEEIEAGDAAANLINIENFVLDDNVDETDEIVSSGRKGYKKLKSDANNFKKEFAEELTLLYSLLDETSKYGDTLEKDLKSMRSSKVRGASKYTNDLASLILTSKQTKLNILKEIAGIKKNIADLVIKESRDNKKSESSNTSNEALASQYFRNILTHGRTNFISRFEEDSDDDDNRSPVYIDNEEDEYNKYLENRLTNTDNPFRSADGDKYIEYENRNVQIKVNKCIDTGEWDFIAIDDVGTRIDDYPLPSKRSVGRLKFSDDGEYATDTVGRIYSVIEYCLPDTDDDDDEYDDEE